MFETNKKIGIIGDLHFKDDLSYSEYVVDQRIPEKKQILDFIVESFKDCNYVVFMGDNLNSKNNSSKTIKDFVSFVERFDDKEVYIIEGNHNKKGDGTSSLDFMKETKKSNWHVMTTPIEHVIDGEKVSFLPYMSKVELGCNTDVEATGRLMEGLKGGTILFAHHAILDTFADHGVSTNDFKEVVLPKEELEKRYKLIIAGHIHKPEQYGNTIITGSIFTDSVGEKEKFIWKIGVHDQSVEKIKLPCREIHKIENPTPEDLEIIDKSSIVKCIITDKSMKVDTIREALKKFDAYLLLEQYTQERKKLHFDEGAIDFSIDSLLEIYSVEKKIDLKKLKLGFELIQ